MSIPAHTHLVSVGDLAASKKVQQLQAELKHVSGAKDQLISSLKEELQGMQEKLKALREDIDQKEQKMKGEQVGWNWIESILSLVMYFQPCDQWIGIIPVHVAGDGSWAGYIFPSNKSYPFIVGTAVQEEYQMASKEEQQLKSELEVTKQASQAKSQKILKLEEELQAMQKGVAFLSDQFEQLQRGLEMLKQKGKDKEGVANSDIQY